MRAGGFKLRHYLSSLSQLRFFRQHALRNDFHALDLLAPIFSKITLIACEQMSRASGDDAAENWHIFKRQLCSQAGSQLCDQFAPLGQPFE